VGQFQRKARNKVRYDEHVPPRYEPKDFELRWRSGSIPHERLASPLIVKPMALADGRFTPIALWLFRGYPIGGEVFLLLGGGSGSREKKEHVPDSDAPFDRLVAPGDRALFAPLGRASTLREAFCGWLRDTKRAEELR
jgi:CRISPR-associated protein Cmr1